MKRIIYLLPITLIVINLLLIALAPDTISKVFVAVMLLFNIFGIILSIFPTLSMTAGLQKGYTKLCNIREADPPSMYNVVVQTQDLFGQKKLNGLYSQYTSKVRMQEKGGQILSDIEEFINEDIILTFTWQNVVLQLPGTFTGLGILGTFLGLILGIREVGFSSIEAALTSVEALIDGIYIAFYTSIVGVLLSILFNIMQKIVRNLLTRSATEFFNEYHTAVIPTIEEQSKFRDARTFAQILEQLEKIPKTPSYSIASSSGRLTNSTNNTLLMPQIIDGMKNKEFTFFLQPKYDINSRQVVSGEALVRWNHPRLGLVSPSVFLPVVEENGYIRKLDEEVWEQVIATIRQWIDKKEKVVPLAINISKTDILSNDVATFLKEKAIEYQIPPRLLDVEIAMNAFLDVPEIATETALKLRESGFKVILDGFSGDIIQLAAIDNKDIDAVKLDLRMLKDSGSKDSVTAIFSQARNENYALSVEGIETMNEVSALRKCGCVEGQGYYFSRPLQQEAFLETLNQS